MKAVFLDSASMAPESLDVRAFNALPIELISYPQTTPAELATRLQDARIAITNKVVIDAQTIHANPQLQLIAVTATGVANVDTQAAAAAGVEVMNVTGYGTAAVAQHTFALLLALANQLPHYTRAATDGRWSAASQFCLMDKSVFDLSGKTLGIIGYGELGQAVATRARAFGMSIIAADSGRPNAAKVTRVPLPELFASSDVISLHCLLTAETQQLINRDTLALMKPTALLINTARGGLIDEADLLTALQTGKIAGAALDVLSQEPPPADHMLLQAQLDNLIITPHNAWISQGARQRIIDTTVANIQKFLQKHTL